MAARAYGSMPLALTFIGVSHTYTHTPAQGHVNIPNTTHKQHTYV